MEAADQINILLVDGQQEKLLYYETILSQLGPVLIRAPTVNQALEQLQHNEFAVVLIDASMPGIDEIKLAELVREHPRLQRTAIILMCTAQLDDDARSRGYRLGAVDYLANPIVPDLLRAKVGIFIELHRKSRQLEKANFELEKRVAERTAQLEAANASLMMALDVARLGTSELDIKSNTMKWSERLFELIGRRPEDLASSLETWVSCVHPDDRAKVEAEIERTQRLREPYRDTHRVLRPDGTTIWCDVRCRYLPDQDGRPERLLGVVKDVSEYKLAEERQRLMVAELHHRVK